MTLTCGDVAELAGQSLLEARNVQVPELCMAAEIITLEIKVAKKASSFLQVARPVSLKIKMTL